MPVRLARASSLEELSARHGGELRGAGAELVARLAPIREARAGDLAPLFSLRYLRDAEEARSRGAVLLVDAELARTARVAVLAHWVHAHAAWVLASVLDGAARPAKEPVVGEGCVIGPHVVLSPGVVLGARVRVGAGAVLGAPGFGWANGPGGQVRAIPQLGGVVIDDDVVIGPLCTVDAGTLSPTRLRRGVRLDAHVHVAHNCDLGEGTTVAAQSGFAGSVTLGRGVLVGGQVGVADHVTVGDGARIAAKSGVIGDVPAGASVAGYPAVPRTRWLRGLARLYKGLPRGARGDDA